MPDSDRFTIALREETRRELDRIAASRPGPLSEDDFRAVFATVAEEEPTTGELDPDDDDAYRQLMGSLGHDVDDLASLAKVEPPERDPLLEEALAGTREAGGEFAAAEPDADEVALGDAWMAWTTGPR